MGIILRLSIRHVRARIMKAITINLHTPMLREKIGDHENLDALAKKETPVSSSSTSTTKSPIEVLTIREKLKVAAGEEVLS